MLRRALSGFCCGNWFTGKMPVPPFGNWRWHRLPACGARHQPASSHFPRQKLSISLALLLLAGTALAAEKSVEDFLPADAIVALCYYGDNPDLQKTAMYQLMQEPEVAEWLASVRQAIVGANQLAAAFLKVDPSLLKPLLGCRVGIALLTAGAAEPPAAVLAARVGGAEVASRQNMGAFLTQLGAVAGPGAEKGEVAGVPITQIGGGPAALCFGFRDDYVFAATSQKALAQALAPNGAKLASLAGLQRSATLIGSPVALLVYNHDQVMERFGAEMPPEARKALDSLGLSQVRTVGLRLGARDRALVATMFIQTAGERRGLVKALASAPVDRSLLRFAPRDASIAWVSNLDFGELYEAVVGTVHAVAAGEGEDARGTIAEFERKAGVNLRQDLFGSLGRGTVVTTSAPSFLPALIVSQALKDGERFEGALTKLVAQLDAFIKAENGEGAGAALRTIAFGNHTIRYLATPGVPVPVAPCYARVGDRVVFAMTPIHLKDYLVFLDKAEPSMLDNPGFKELEALVPKNATSVSYSDFGEEFVTLYRLVGPFLTMVQGIPRNPIEIDLANMPATRTIRKHMFGSISYAYVTDDTIVLESQSPLGVGLLSPAPAVFVGGIGAGMLIPALTRAREEARRVQSMNNLRQISMAVMMYANDHDNDLPPGFATLFEAKLLQGDKLLVAPNDRAPPRLADGKPCSYVYLLDGHPGLKIKLNAIQRPTETPLAWEREAFARGFQRAVTFVDGHVEMVVDGRFAELMELREEFLKAKGPKKAGGEF